MEHPISVLEADTEKLLKYKVDSCRHYNLIAKHLDFDILDKNVKENIKAVRILEKAAADEIVDADPPVVAPPERFGISGKYWVHVCFMAAGAIIGYLLHYIS